MRNQIRCSSVITGMLGVLLAFVQIDAPAQVINTNRSDALEEIVVTASKRSETIQNAPTALTAIRCRRILRRFARTRLVSAASTDPRRAGKAGGL